jgi:hypothetical protein
MPAKAKAPSLAKQIDLGAAPTKRGEELRADIHDYGGAPYISLRRWYQDDAGAFLPGRGLTVHARLIPALRNMIEAAEREALRLGLLAEEDFELAGRPIPPEITRAA